MERAAAGTAALLPEPPFTERVRVLRRHFDLMIEVFGEELGCRMFRKVAPWYAKRFGPAAEFNKGVVRIATRADFEAVLAHYLGWRAQFVDEQGELLPRFQQAPMVASFMQEPGVAQRQAIPVPKGPVDVCDHRAKMLRMTSSMGTSSMSRSCTGSSSRSDLQTATTRSRFTLSFTLWALCSTTSP